MPLVSNVPHDSAQWQDVKISQFIFSVHTDSYSFISFGGRVKAKVIAMVIILDILDVQTTV